MIPKFTNHDSLTEHCKRKGLSNYRVLRAEWPSGFRTLVLAEGTQAVEETQDWEAMAIKIDIIAALKKFDEKEGGK